MTENEFILQDRLNAIRDTINKYGEDNFYISFSGGKDSTILHHLVDMAIPNNQIPRVYINTGIEYLDIVEFVKHFASYDKRFVIVSPTKNIKNMLDEVGYPFKSKRHSETMRRWQTGHIDKPTRIYFKLEEPTEHSTHVICPKCLMYQKNDDFNIKISAECCNELKKKPAHKWAKEHNKSITITGMRVDEGGNRVSLACFSHNYTKFHPLVKVNDEWEDWFIDKYNIELCKLYYPPFKFKRTGCKGCPYTLDLKEQLEVMARLLPNERKQCEIIWKPIYDEYRRIGYRLKEKTNGK